MYADLTLHSRRLADLARFQTSLTWTAQAAHIGNQKPQTIPF